MKIEQTSINLNNQYCPIYIGENLLQNQSLLRSYVTGRQVMIVSNETVAALYLNSLKAMYYDYQCDTSILPDGEQYKNIEQWECILHNLAFHNHHRDTTLIALGGGVIGDITGFAAACYQRGVDFIQLPTTLLAQVDASIGGKTAINHPAGKNLIGTFYQPKVVIIDLNTLDTLPEREFGAGLAEVIKTALIIDKEFFIYLENNMSYLLRRDYKSLKTVIRRSVEIKCDIVSTDEKEKSSKRTLLNLGHTFAHAIEQLFGYRKWLHGEAVSIGLALSARLSHHKSWLDIESVQRICHLLIQIPLPIYLPESININALLSVMHMDKKVVNQQMHLVLLDRLGHAFISNQITDRELKGFLEITRF